MFFLKHECFQYSKSNKDGKKDTKHCYSDVDAGRKTIRRMRFAYIDLKIPKDAQ